MTAAVTAIHGPAAAVPRIRAYTLDHPQAALPEQTGRLQEQQEDQNAEENKRRIRDTEVPAGVGLHQADRHAAEQAPREATEAAERERDEPVDRQGNPGRYVDPRYRPDKRAERAAQAAGQDERAHPQAGYVHSPDNGGGHVVGRGPAGQPPQRVPRDGVQSEGNDHGRGYEPQVNRKKPPPEQAEPIVTREEVHRPGGAPPRREQHSLNDDRRADGRHQERVAALGHDRADGQQFLDGRDQAPRSRPADDRHPPGPAEVTHDEPGEERAEHDDLPLREVENARLGERDVVAERDEGVDRTHRQPRPQDGHRLSFDARSLTRSSHGQTRPSLLMA